MSLKLSCVQLPVQYIIGQSWWLGRVTWKPPAWQISHSLFSLPRHAGPSWTHAAFSSYNPRYIVPICWIYEAGCYYEGGYGLGTEASCYSEGGYGFGTEADCYSEDGYGLGTEADCYSEDGYGLRG